MLIDNNTLGNEICPDSIYRDSRRVGSTDLEPTAADEWFDGTEFAVLIAIGVADGGSINAALDDTSMVVFLRSPSTPRSVPSGWLVVERYM